MQVKEMLLKMLNCKSEEEFLYLEPEFETFSSDEKRVLAVLFKSITEMRKLYPFMEYEEMIDTGLAYMGEKMKMEDKKL